MIRGSASLAFPAAVALSAPAGAQQLQGNEAALIEAADVCVRATSGGAQHWVVSARLEGEARFAPVGAPVISLGSKGAGR
jgi:hypothetical protein